ncbi:Ger(x)C family spore germination protein [Lentibacillus sp. N15]|uniref:Ger(x)C family spore germination protein n=1 Tax=Lentibacillus songyuanensis TaxID=3136161 RepID=UPI0031BB9316
MIKRVGLFHLFIAVTLVLTGCWDQVEIEQRGFIVGSGIDLAGSKENETQELTLTHQFVVPAGIGTPSEGGGDTQAFDNLTASGDSMFDISRKMADQTSRIPFYEHEKVVVISNNVAERPYLFGKVMDIFLRNPEMRRSIKVVVTDGKASDVLNTKPESEKIPIIYLDSIMENSFTNASEIEPVKIGTVHENLMNKLSYVLPQIIPKEKSMESKGAAVFKGYNNQMIGSLNGLDAKGLNLITGKAQEGVIKIAIHKKNITYELEKANSKIKLNTDDIRHMDVQVNIDTSGVISETFGTQNLFQGGTVREIEKQVSEEIKKIAEQTIHKAQEELETDIFGIGKMLKERHYDQWQQMKDDWDHGENYFTDVTFHVNVTSRIRTTGNVNKTKKK